jgi:deoxyribodipyrimidine photolyase
MAPMSRVIPEERIQRLNANDPARGKYTLYWMLSAYTERTQVVAAHMSDLSGWLHFGQISPLDVALRVGSSRGHATNQKAAFMEQLLVRRELVLQWTSSHAHAYRTALRLNNRYFLDGRDVNTYASIAWLFGMHDRAHQERNVFGKVRYMSSAGLKRKIDVQQYLDHVRGLKTDE